MGRSKRRAGEVPQWVRDFVARREQQLLEENEGQVSSSAYLLCPFSNDEIEAIRAWLWKLMQEAIGAIPTDFDRLMFEHYLREFLLLPLSRQEMQEAVVRHYGWKEWSEDPWGDSATFDKWLDSTHDNEMLVWAANDTAGGRFYLSYRLLWNLALLDYSSISPVLLMDWVGTGAENYLLLKKYSGWERFDYPEKPLPTEFVNQQIITIYPSCPFMGYAFTVNSVSRWQFAVKELERRAIEHPELAGFLKYHTATDTIIAELCRKLAPKDYRLPEEYKSREQLEEAMRKPLSSIARRHKVSYVAAQGGLFEAVYHWKAKAYEAVIAGLEGKLIPSLLRIVKNRIIDLWREENPQLAALWKEAVRENKPKNPIERWALMEKVKEEYEKMPPWKKAPLSLDRETEKEDGETSCLVDLIPGEQGLEVYNEIERRDVLAALIEEARLPKRQQLVIDLTREGKTDRQIVLALEEAFNKVSSEGNVRKLRHDGIQRLKQVASELPPDEIDNILAQLS
ncbi:MAG: hypothetical protein IMY79_02940 [Chloroflexi bacterium]|nr:hypothetical protein [Chloroflexota bacterium]